MKREPGKRKRVPNHACVHCDEHLFIVITLRWQMVQITHLDAI
jgi:hypothetical protein